MACDNSPTNHNELHLAENYDLKSHLKQVIADNLDYKERLEILNYLQDLGRCDIISNVPTAISTLIFQYFSPLELCSFRLGKILYFYNSFFFNILI
jgi:hypothetical protein